MKRIVSLLIFNSLIIGIGLTTTFTSCTKEGPMGPAGPAGEEQCAICHNNTTTILAAQMQYANSSHFTGGNFNHSDSTCAHCHTSEGFIESISTGQRRTAENINNPTPPGCKTCHNIHKNYELTDWELTTTDSVYLDINNELIEFASSNLCANCHQPRIPDPLPVLGGNNTHSLTSANWGPHYGTQAAVFGGTGGFEIGGNYPEKTTSGHHGASCNDCHMAQAYGDMAGGHTMKMNYLQNENTVELLTSCESCHQNVYSFDHNNVQTEIDNLLSQLETLLTDADYIDSDHRIKVTFGSPLKLSDNELGVIMNYMLIRHDGSNGIHNYAYTKKLLENSIAEAESW